RVAVATDTTDPVDTAVRLEVPPGWTATPASQPVKFERADESRTVRFDVKPASTASNGEFHVRAVVTANGQSFDRGFEVIEYPHIRRYHIYDSAAATLKVIDVRTPANLRIGYVMGVGDQVPSAIEQLGATVDMISPDDLAWGKLSRFDAIVTGVLADDKDSRYHDVLECDDDFTFNKGPKTGALVETTYGKGHWVYVGLGLWRQLPSGTDGAYQLLANLISLGKK